MRRIGGAVGRGDAGVLRPRRAGAGHQPHDRASSARSRRPASRRVEVARRRAGRSASRRCRTPLPIARTCGASARSRSRSATTAAAVLESFQRAAASSALLDYAFYQVAAINGYDSFGHYLRARLILNTCSRYYTAPVDGLLEPLRARLAAPSAASAAVGRRGERPGPAPHRRRARRARTPTPSRPPCRRRRRRRSRSRAHGSRGTAVAGAGAALGADSGRPPNPGRHAAPRADATPTQARGRSSTTCSGRTAVRSRGSSIAGNPVLIGAATVLVIIVAMFLSYNANAGLPFVPDLPAQGRVAERRHAGQGQRGADRRRARRRRRHDHGEARSRTAPASRVIGIKLERAVDPLPKDSTVIIRPKSALGLKYVEITRGTLRRRATRTATRSRSRRRGRPRSSSTSS